MACICEDLKVEWETGSVGEALIYLAFQVSEEVLGKTHMLWPEFLGEAGKDFESLADVWACAHMQVVGMSNETFHVKFLSAGIGEGFMAVRCTWERAGHHGGDCGVAFFIAELGQEFAGLSALLDQHGAV